VAGFALTSQTRTPIHWRFVPPPNDPPTVNVVEEVAAGTEATYGSCTTMRFGVIGHLGKTVHTDRACRCDAGRGDHECDDEDERCDEDPSRLESVAHEAHEMPPFVS
jgi:hypothetical protein